MLASTSFQTLLRSLKRPNFRKSTIKVLPGFVESDEEDGGDNSVQVSMQSHYQRSGHLLSQYLQVSKQHRLQSDMAAHQLLTP